MKEGDREMSRRIKSTDISPYYQAVLEHCPQEHDAPYVFAGIVDENAMAEDTRRSVFATVSSQVLGQFRYDMPSPSEQINLHDFASSWGTIYVTIKPERAEALRPLVSAFIEAITAAWRSASRSEGTLLLALDEVANVAPLPNLPAILTAGAGDQIQCLLGMQEPGHASRWADQRSVITGAPTHVAVFPNLRNDDYYTSLSKLLGSHVQYDLQVHVRPDTPSGARFADEATLIAERLMLERARLAASGRRRQIAVKSAARNIAATRLRQGIKNRLEDSGGNAEAVVDELNRYTTVRQIPQRRLTIEADTLAQAPPGTFFLLTGARGEFHTVAPWFNDPLWAEILHV